MLSGKLRGRWMEYQCEQIGRYEAWEGPPDKMVKGQRDEIGTDKYKKPVP